MIFKATLGNTSYEMQDTHSGINVEFTRKNSDGESKFYVPRDLIMKYAQHIVKVHAEDLAKRLFKCVL